MKKTHFIGLTATFLLAATLGCQSKQPTGDQLAATAQMNTRTAEQSSPQATINPQFGSHTWYKGDVGGTAIWFYFNSADGEYISAIYGYESQKGAGIALNGKKNGDNLELSYESYGKTPYKESFTGSIDRSTGYIKGTWKNDKKSLPFQLQPLNVIPNSGKELLDCAANITKANFPEYSDNTGLSLNDSKLYYTEKKYAAQIPNLTDFLSDIQPNYEDGEVLTPSEKSGLLFGKTALPNNQWLVFFAVDINEEAAPTVGAYTEDNDGMLCAAIFDETGKCLNATRLGNDGDDSYFMDFGCEQTTATQLSLTWSFFMRDQARIEDGEEKITIEIKDGKFVAQ